MSGVGTERTMQPHEVVLYDQLHSSTSTLKLSIGCRDHVLFTSGKDETEEGKKPLTEQSTGFFRGTDMSIANTTHLPSVGS